MKSKLHDPLYMDPQYREVLTLIREHWTPELRARVLKDLCERFPDIPEENLVEL